MNSIKKSMKDKMNEVNKQDALNKFLTKISKEDLYASLQNTYAQLSNNNEELLECLYLLYPITAEGYEIMVVKVDEDSDTLWKFMLSKIDDAGNPVGQPLFQITYDMEVSIPPVCSINSILMSQLKSRMAQINEKTNA